MVLQPFAQNMPCPIQKHADVTGGEVELFGCLRVAEAIEADQTENLRLPRIEHGERLAQMVAQLTCGSNLIWLRRAGGTHDFHEQWPQPLGLPQSKSERFQGPRRSESPQQPGP